MRLLVATTPGDRDDDFTFGVIDGELVEPVTVCDTDWDSGVDACGCARAFIGLGSGGTTTTAKVAEVKISRSALEDIVAAAHPAYSRRLVIRTARDLINYGGHHLIGTVVGIHFYRLEVRS